MSDTPDVLRIDVSVDGEYVGSVECHEERIGGRQSFVISCDDGRGELLVYRKRVPWHYRTVGSWAYTALNVAQSAFAKGWWARR